MIHRLNVAKIKQSIAMKTLVFFELLVLLEHLFIAKIHWIRNLLSAFISSDEIWLPLISAPTKLVHISNKSAEQWKQAFFFCNMYNWQNNLYVYIFIYLVFTTTYVVIGYHLHFRLLFSTVATSFLYYWFVGCTVLCSGDCGDKALQVKLLQKVFVTKNGLSKWFWLSLSFLHCHGYLFKSFWFLGM